MDASVLQPRDDEPAIRPSRHRIRVVEAYAVTPLMRRVTIHAPTITGLALRPAQDVGLVFADVEGRELRRRYTITRVDPGAQTFVLDGVMHGHGPGASWFVTAQPGVEIDVIGPRGKIELAASADTHLFIGDESGLPAVAELLASLPNDARATAVIEIASAAEEQLIENADIRWVHRNGQPPGRPELLTAALALLDPIGAPVQAYVLGESRTVVALTPALAALGVSRAQTFVKGYWNRPRGL
jgi:NADPH-dependent ferric siderophore reductase